MSRSATRERRERPAAVAAATTLPHLRAAATSKSSGSKSASTCCKRAWRRAFSKGSRAKWGPAASSARVMVEIASMSGNAATTAGSSQSITTEVSASPSLIEQALLDRGIEIASEGRRVNARTGRRQGGNFGPRHERAPTMREWTQLSHRRAITGHHEAGTRLHSREYLCVLVAQITLGDDTAHARSVANKATRRYAGRRCPG